MLKLEAYIVNICQLLVKAGVEILEVYHSADIGKEIKVDNSPVTRADKNSSFLINQGLKHLYPTIPVIDEENPIPDYYLRKDWKAFFLVDPLDGTKEFINRNGEFCINLALLENNIPVEGWIYHPPSGKGWYSKSGSGVFEFDGLMNFSPVVPARNHSGKLRIVASRSFFSRREESLIQLIGQKYEVEVIFLGSSLKHTHLMEGFADVYLKAGYCSEWDTAPGQLMVEETGGIVLRLDNFMKMGYNKPVLDCPDFVMIGWQYNNCEFIQYLKEITGFYVQNG